MEKTNEKSFNKKLSKTTYLVWLAVLLAFVIVFQVFGSYIKIGGTNISLVLVPIVLGGMLLGCLAGAFLGLAFSLVVITMGYMGADTFTNVLLMQAPVGTILTVLLKGVLAGLVPALIYKLLNEKHPKVATFVASILAPVVNTSIFIIGMLFMQNVLKEQFLGQDGNVIYFLFITCAGINFLVELAINVILAPVLLRVANVINKQFRR